MQNRFIAAAAVMLALAALVSGQQPRPQPPRGGDSTREFLGLGRKPDPAVAARGEKTYAASCAFCHGPDARGAQGPSLVRSDIVLHDDKGELIGPVLLKGRPEKGMPAVPGMSATEIAEIAEYLHLLVERSANRGLYSTLYANDVFTGDAKAGEAYFNGAGGCRTCHSPAGDLAHVASRYSGINLQNRWLWPSGGRGDAAPPRATITLPSGEHVTGRVRALDDFDVSIVDAAGAYRSWPRTAVTVQLEDPLQAHRERLARYSDADIHNVTAYLATLK